MYYNKTVKRIFNRIAHMTHSLMTVFRNNDSATVERLIKSGEVDIECTSRFMHRTILMVASRNGYTDIVGLLLRHGADPNHQDINGETALMEASRNGYTDIVELLLRQGANKDQQNGDGETALMMASRHGYTDIVGLLLQYGANTDLQDEVGETALMEAKFIDIVELLLRYGANTDLQDEDGETALMEASYYEYTDIVELLLRYGANTKLQNGDGETARMISSRRGYINIVKLLDTHEMAYVLHKTRALSNLRGLEYDVRDPNTVPGAVVRHVVSRGLAYDPYLMLRELLL